MAEAITRELGGKLGCCRQCGGLERRPQREVFDRVAGDRHLREGNDVSAESATAVALSKDQLDVAL